MALKIYVLDCLRPGTVEAQDDAKGNAPALLEESERGAVHQRTDSDGVRAAHDDDRASAQRASSAVACVS